MTTEQTPRNEEDCDMLMKVRTFSSNMTFWLSVDCRLDTSPQLIAQEIFGRCSNFQQQRATCWVPNVSEFQLRVCDCWRVELRFVVRFSSKRLHAGKEPLSTVRWSQCHLKWKQCKEQRWLVGYSSLTRINMLEVIRRFTPPTIRSYESLCLFVWKNSSQQLFSVQQISLHVHGQCSMEVVWGCMSSSPPLLSCLQ